MAEQGYLLNICIICFPDELLTQSLSSYAAGNHDLSTRSVVGVFIFPKRIKVDTNNIQLILSDISTHPNFFKRLYPHHIRHASAAVFAFSKNNPRFVESAIDYYHEFRKHIPSSTVPVAFIGLQDESEVVTQAEGQSIAQELGADYFEIAATDLQALDTVVKSLSHKVVINLKTS